MKTKFKDFLLYSLACVGAVSLLLSVIDKPKENAQPIDRYHVAGADYGFVMYNTQTGEYKLLNVTEYREFDTFAYPNYDKRSF